MYATSVGLRTVEQRFSLFISRIHPEVTDDIVKDYLTRNKITDFECEKLKTKYNTYCSFRVILPQKVMESVLNESFWPSGTLVKEFLSKKRTHGAYVPSRTFLGKPQPA